MQFYCHDNSCVDTSVITVRIGSILAQSALDCFWLGDLPNLYKFTSLRVILSRERSRGRWYCCFLVRYQGLRRFCCYLLGFCQVYNRCLVYLLYFDGRCQLVSPIRFLRDFQNLSHEYVGAPFEVNFAHELAVEILGFVRVLDCALHWGRLGLRQKNFDTQLL